MIISYFYQIFTIYNLEHVCATAQLVDYILILIL